MLRHLLRLRFTILARMLFALGWWRLTLLTVSFIAGLWYLSQFVTTDVQALLVAGFTVSTLGSVHLARRDGRFLKTIGAPAWTLYAAEYLAYASPILIILLIIGKPLSAAVLVIGCFILPVFGLDDVRRSKARRRRSWISRRGFEWIAGIRRTLPFFVLVYLLGAFFVTLPFSVLIALVTLATLVTTFFHVGEGRAMIEIFGLPPKAFLYDKVVLALTIFWICCAPLAILFILFHAQYWMLLLVVAAGCTILITTAVLAKYAFYVEGERFSNPHTVVTTISLGSMLLFVPALVAIGLVFWLYFRAVANLTLCLKPAGG